MRTYVAVWAILCSLVGGSAIRGGEVSLSHLMLKIGSGVGPPPEIDIDNEVLNRFCGDEDGCEINVDLTSGTKGATATGRLFLDTASGRWHSSGSAGSYYFDNNGTSESVLILNAAPNACVMSDGEYVHLGDDEAVGFEVYINATEALTCIFTISD